MPIPLSLPSAHSRATPDVVTQLPSPLWITAVGLGISVVLALSIATQTYLPMRGHGHSFVAILLWQLSCWILWAFATPWIVRMGTRTLSARPLTRRDLVRVALIGLTVSFVHNVLATALTIWFQPLLPVVAYGFEQTLADQMRSLYALDFLVFSLLFMGGGSYAVFHRARQLELRESRLEGALAKAQLEALRLELQPHFLFNVHNSIAALIRVKDNTKALEMLVSLSELMRSTLNRPADQLTSLGGELDFVKRYVALQQTRFEDHLLVEYVVDPDCLERQVPVFLLQPLVENAIRHGVQQARRCRIEISATLLANGNLRVSVCDDGKGLAPGFDIDRDGGTGLTNTKSRLHQLYHGTATFSIRPAHPSGVIVELTLPKAPLPIYQTGAA